jgi:hypothetical protein
MTLSKRDQRALLLLIPAALALVLKLGLFSPGPQVAEAAVDTVEMAEKRLAKLRQLAATVPAKEAAAKQAAGELAIREAGLIQADTAQQAQAQLLQVIRTLGKNENIDARGGEFGPVRPLGADYGEVSVAVAFDCRIEQLLNFLAGLTAQPALLATSEMRITAANAKEKTLNVRLTLSGVVPRRLVPEQKGSTLF